MKTRIGCCAYAALLVCAALPARAGKYRVVFPIAKTSAYAYVDSPLAADPDGNLYGELETAPIGAFFELKAAQGYAVRHILYSFQDYHLGSLPFGGLTIDRLMILGTASEGGPYNNGTAFNLGEPNKISYTSLHDFGAPGGAPPDGVEPDSGLVPGPNHLFYGTAQAGGRFNMGVAFRISSSAASPDYEILHQFGGAGDGSVPSAGRLVADAQGRLFGTTISGGTNNLGTVYMLQKSGAKWVEQIIYSFGRRPDVFALIEGNLAIDNAGTLFGCGGGGATTHGGVFRLAPPTQPGAPWQESIIYNLGRQANDGSTNSYFSYSYACGIAIDPATDYIVATVPFGGASGNGALFSVRPGPNRHGWVERVQHSFFGSSIDGGNPTAPPLKLGDTYYGGNTQTASIYAFTP